MDCPICGVEMRIVESRVTVSGDNSADTSTRVVMRQRLRCKNPRCGSAAQGGYEQVKEHLLYGPSQAE